MRKLVKPKTMLEIANQKKKGWSFIDDGKGVTITKKKGQKK